MSVCILCPTRGRPEIFARLVESVERTSEDAVIVAYLDDDDPSDYRAVVTSERVRWLRGGRVGVAAACNHITLEHADHQSYGLLTDDSTITTPGWERHVEKAFEAMPGRIGVVSPAHNFGDHVDMPFVSRPWLDTVGYFALPKVYHWCWPTALAMLGEPLGIHECAKDEFWVEHDEKGPSHMEAIVEDAQKFYWWLLFEYRPTLSKLKAARNGGT